MSISFRQIRKNSTAQGRFKDLVADLQRFQAEQIEVDNPDFRVKNRVMHSKLSYHDPYFTSKTKSSSTPFYMPFEPDGKYLVAMWDNDHNGRYMKDGSGRGNHGFWMNNPNLKEGIDLGFGISMYADYDWSIYSYVNEKPELRFSSADYFSITFRIYPTDINPSDGVGGTKYRTIFHKCDSSDITGAHMGQINPFTVTSGYTMAVLPDGKIRFTLKRAGISYSVETLPGVISANDPPFAYDVTLTVNQIDKVSVPAQTVTDPGDLPGADVEAEPPLTPPLISPRMEISVNNQFYQLYTTEHLPFVDDPFRTLRFGATFNFNMNDPVLKHWFKFKGGIQQIRFYRNYILTFPEIQNLFINKLTTREMPFGSPALAGMILVFQDPLQALGGFDSLAFDPDAFETSVNDFFINGFPGYDPLGFDIEGFDTQYITEQGTVQNGGYDPRGFSFQGYHTLPSSQS